MFRALVINAAVSDVNATRDMHYSIPFVSNKVVTYYVIDVFKCYGFLVLEAAG